MRSALALVAVLCSATAFAQSSPPPAVGGKPQAQAKPRTAAPAKSQSQAQAMAAKLEACLDIDDGTKERLDCYDAVIQPEPKEKSPPAKRVTDCRFTKEEDERLACFNGFVEKKPKPPKS